MKTYNVEFEYKDETYYGQIEALPSEVKTEARDWVQKEMKAKNLIGSDVWVGIPDGRWWSVYSPVKGGGHSIYGKVWIDVEEVR